MILYVNKNANWVTLKSCYTAFVEQNKKYNVENNKIMEFDKNNVSGPVGNDEPITIIGHGSIGKIGDFEGNNIAEVLKKILPPTYRGDIRLYSCCSAIKSVNGKSLIEEIADNLKKHCTTNYKIYGINGYHVNFVDENSDIKRVAVLYDKYGEAKKCLNCLLNSIITEIDANQNVGSVLNNCQKLFNIDNMKSVNTMSLPLMKRFYSHIQTILANPKEIEIIV